MSTFSKRLKELMDKLDWNQVQLSKKADVDQSVISKYLKDIVEPTKESLDRLAKALGTTPNYLMGWPDPLSKTEVAFTVEVPSTEALELAREFDDLPEDSLEKELIRNIISRRRTNKQGENTPTEQM